MRLHLILGATGSGKTEKAMQLAHQLGTPLIILDRIQCYPELAMTSGRGFALPSPFPIIHLSERSVSEGDYAPDLAYTHLHEYLHSLRHHHFLLLEGGSISLTRLLCTDTVFLRYHDVSLEIVQREPAEHRQKVRTRILTMLSPAPEDGTSMLTELQHTWQYVEQRPFLRTLVGFDAALDWLTKKRLSINSLDTLTNADIFDLSLAITQSHLRYAQTQQQHLHTILKQGHKDLQIVLNT